MHVEHDPTRTIGRTPPAHGQWLKALARGVRRPLALATAAPLVSGALLLAQAWLLAGVVHAAVIAGAPAAALLPDVAAIAALVLLRAGLAAAGEQAGAAAAEAVKRRVREAIFDRLVAMGPVALRDRQSGAIAAAVVEQVEALDGFFARWLPAAIAAAFLPLAFAIVIMPLDLVMGLLLLLTAPMIPLFMALVGWGAESASRQHADAFARLSGRFADRLRGLSTLVLHGRAEAEAEAVRGASEDLAGRTMSVLRIAFLSSAVLEFFAALGVAGIALYVGLNFLGLLDLRSVPLTLEVGLFALLMAPEVYMPLRQLAAHYHDRGAARAAAASIADALDELPDTEARPAAPPVLRRLGDGRGLAVAVDGLSLTAGDGTSIIRDASFAIAPGERIALLGESGSGKSTLLEAMAGLRGGTGAIRLDDTAMDEVGVAERTERIAFLPQRPRILAGSIAENIALGRPGAGPVAIALAADRAHVSAIAATLPDGLDTVIGARGLGLSGGEAQRVALARIFLRDPALLLLDEPTAHLDEQTEAEVLDALDGFATGRTLIVATHSPAVAARMDRVLRVAGGQVLPALLPRPRRPLAEGA